jgi:hypothetical protein
MVSLLRACPVRQVCQSSLKDKEKEIDMEDAIDLDLRLEIQRLARWFFYSHLRILLSIKALFGCSGLEPRIKS